MRNYAQFAHFEDFAVYFIDPALVEDLMHVLTIINLFMLFYVHFDEFICSLLAYESLVVPICAGLSK